MRPLVVRHFPPRTVLGEGRSTPPENADDSGDYALLQESDNSEGIEKKETMKISDETEAIPQAVTQHFNIDMTPPDKDPNGRPSRSPPGLVSIEFPPPRTRVPTRREVRDIAKKNMMALFGHEVVLIPNTNRRLLSAESSEEDAELEHDMNLTGGKDQIVHPEGWQSQ